MSVFLFQMKLQGIILMLLVLNHQANALWDWNNRPRIRAKKLLLSSHHEENDEENDDKDNEINDDQVPTLNVSAKDSPYALIDRFFPERGKYQEEQGLNNQEDFGNLKPNEVWLSDGDLLVLKGGSTPNRKGFDNPWKPLDDYVAPYREPKLPPPDFVPSDTGVGVSLPPENSYDEESYINQMENFHSKRRAGAVIFTPETTPITTPAPVTTTVKPAITSAGYFVSTSTPVSYSYAFQEETNEITPDFTPVTALPPIARSSTTPLPTISSSSQPLPSTNNLIVRELKPRKSKSFYTEYYGQKVNEIDVDNKPAAAEERHDYQFFVKPDFRARRKSAYLPPPPAAPAFSPRPNSLTGPTLAASTVISSLKPRFYHHNQRHYQHRRGHHFHHRPPKPPPVLATPATRRSSNGDHRYVSFYRGQIGGQSWGYSYHL